MKINKRTDDKKIIIGSINFSQNLFNDFLQVAQNIAKSIECLVLLDVIYLILLCQTGSLSSSLCIASRTTTFYAGVKEYLCEWNLEKNHILLRTGLHGKTMFREYSETRL